MSGLAAERSRRGRDLPGPALEQHSNQGQQFKGSRRVRAEGVATGGRRRKVLQAQHLQPGHGNLNASPEELERRRQAAAAYGQHQQQAEANPVHQELKAELAECKLTIEKLEAKVHGLQVSCSHAYCCGTEWPRPCQKGKRCLANAATPPMNTRVVATPSDCFACPVLLHMHMPSQRAAQFTVWHACSCSTRQQSCLVQVVQASHAHGLVQFEVPTQGRRR